MTSSGVAPSRRARFTYCSRPLGLKLMTFVTTEIRNRVFGSRCLPDSPKKWRRCVIAAGLRAFRNSRPRDSPLGFPTRLTPWKSIDPYGQGAVLHLQVEQGVRLLVEDPDVLVLGRVRIEEDEVSGRADGLVHIQGRGDEHDHSGVVVHALKLLRALVEVDPVEPHVR